jgi:hypothetical protein
MTDVAALVGWPSLLANWVLKEAFEDSLQRAHNCEQLGQPRGLSTGLRTG